MEEVQKEPKWVSYSWPAQEAGKAELKEFQCNNMTFVKPETGVLSLLEYQVAECEPILLAAKFEKISE